MIKISFLEVLGKTGIFGNNRAKTGNCEPKKAVREAI